MEVVTRPTWTAALCDASVARSVTWTVYPAVDEPDEGGGRYAERVVDRCRRDCDRGAHPRENRVRRAGEGDRDRVRGDAARRRPTTTPPARSESAFPATETFCARDRDGGRLADLEVGDVGLGEAGRGDHRPDRFFDGVAGRRVDAREEVDGDDQAVGRSGERRGRDCSLVGVDGRLSGGDRGLIGLDRRRRRLAKSWTGTELRGLVAERRVRDLLGSLLV